MIKRLTVYLIISLSLFPIHYAQAQKDTLKVLLIGNSYTYFENMPQIISLISDQSDIKLITKKSVIGGATLKNHWLSERGLNSKQKIIDGNYDIVVLQEQSMGAINKADRMIKYSNLFCDLIKRSGAKPYLFVTWARKKIPQHQDIINSVYKQIAKNNDAVLIPVGDAWANAKKIRPDLELYSFDGSHPSTLGSFLTACVFTKTILDEFPETIKNIYLTKDLYGESILLMNIDQLDLTFVKRLLKD